MQDRFDADLLEKDQSISILNDRVKILEERIEKYEENEDAAEAAENITSIVVSGPNIPTYNNGESCKTILHQLFRDKYNSVISPSDMLEAKRIGKTPLPNTPDKRSFLLKLSSIDTKKNIFAASKAIKPEGLYVRENLTRTRNSILYVLRKARREFPTLISGCSSIDGKVFAWIPPPNPHATGARDSRMSVNSYRKLDTFCRDVLNQATTTLVPDWIH